MGSLIKQSIDGVELDGYSTIQPGDNVAVLHFPGLAGNFYESSTILPFAKQYRNKGIGFISCNTRGHDYIADTLIDGTWSGGGGAHTLLVEYQNDMHSWYKWTIEQGISKVILQAHSASAVALANYVYSLDTITTKIMACVYISPADMRVELESSVGNERYQQLRQIAQDSNDFSMMPDDALDGYLLSKKVYCEFTNENSGWSILRWNSNDNADEIFSRVPSLVTFGSEEESEFLKLDLVSSRYSDAGALVAIIDGAAHSYRGYETSLSQVVVNFVDQKANE
mgnify:CR=1 FL=1